MRFSGAVRLAWRRPAIAGAILGALALSIAAACSLFSVVDGLLLRPLPFDQASQLVAVDYPTEGGRPPRWVVLPEFGEKRETLRAALERSPLVQVTTQAGFQSFWSREAALDFGLEVTGIDSRFFRLLRLRPAAGVDFEEADERNRAALVLESDEPLPVILGHDLAIRVFGTATGALGVRELAGRRVRVVGVMEPGVKFPAETNVWAPVSSTRNRPPTYVRLRPEASVHQLAAAFQDLDIRPLRDAVRPGGSQALVVLLVAATLLLLVTWIQVAALLVSEVMGRLREIGVRLALGASRYRVVRQFAVQNMALASVAFGAAWLAITPLTGLIVSLLPHDLQRGQYLAPEFRTFAFSAMVSLLGIVLLTLWPGILAYRLTPITALGDRLGDSHRGAHGLRQFLMVVQVTLTALLLYLSGLTLHSFMRITVLDYGFDAANVLLFSPPAWAPFKATPRQYDAAFQEHVNRKVATIETLRLLPDVSATGLHAAPFGVGFSRTSAAPGSSFEGRPRPEVQARANAVGIDFVRTLGVRILAGADFDPSMAGDRMILVNETLAQQLIPDTGGSGPPLWTTVVGKQFRTDAGGGRIVGVTRDLVQSSPATPAVAEFFQADRGVGAATVIAIRVGAQREPAVRAVLEQIWGRLSPRQISRLQDHKNRVLAPYRSQSLILVLITLCCIPIAAIGLTGTLSYSVRLRTREMAVRLALGADPVRVRQAVVLRAVATTAVGMVLGIGMGAVSSRILAQQLFDVQPVDFPTIITVGLALLALAWLAAFLPAREASRIDPAAALRRL